MTKEKFGLQDSQYSFPYHYIPHYTGNGTSSRFRVLSWGLEYLCYMRFVAERIIALEPKRVLDVGCGDGRLINMLSSTQVEAVGVDLSSKALAFARAFNLDKTFIKADVSQIDDSFDLVSAIEVLEHIPDGEVRGFVYSLVSKVKKGGYLLISAPTTGVPVNRKHYRHYDRELLLDHIGPSNSGLQLLETHYIFNRDDLIYRAYTKLSTNHIWAICVAPLERLLWRRVWRRLKIANEENGAHLVMLFKKK